MNSADSVVFRFRRTGNLYIGKPPDATLLGDSVVDKSMVTDWHVALGHPSDPYLDRFLKIHNISSSPATHRAKNCAMCQSCKLKRSPHSNPLPQAPFPFHTIHSDVLQINPPSKHGFRYVLVLIDDFSRFNRIYILRAKSKSESNILAYFNKIRNRFGRFPAVFHLDRGGEFSSGTFLAELHCRGTTVERGPADSPQTNGLAKRFNQTLLTKL